MMMFSSLYSPRKGGGSEGQQGENWKGHQEKEVSLKTKVKVIPHPRIPNYYVQKHKLESERG